LVCRALPTLDTGTSEPKVERENLPVFSKLTPNAIECNLVPVRPQDWRRELYAVHLSHLLFDFIVAHEVTHIGHGHVGYTDAECGLPFVSERRWLEGTPLKVSCLELA